MPIGWRPMSLNAIKIVWSLPQHITPSSNCLSGNWDFVWTSSNNFFLVPHSANQGSFEGCDLCVNQDKSSDFPQEEEEEHSHPFLLWIRALPQGFKTFIGLTELQEEGKQNKSKGPKIDYGSKRLRHVGRIFFSRVTFILRKTVGGGSISGCHGPTSHSFSMQ